MLLILYAFFLQSLTLLCFAFVDLPIKNWRDGSKSAFVQVPYVNTMRNTKLLQLQQDMSQLWPKGVVRYYIDNQTYDTYINSSIQTAMTIIESESCIEFHEESEKPEDNRTWLHFTNPNKDRACVHEPQFMQSGEVVVTLGYDCLRQRDILHTLLHGIGFKDEVTHPYRDKYIKILWSNIHTGYRNLFIKETTDSVRSSVEYDPFSVMHFHERAYSINGKATILTLEPGLVILPSETLSQLDRMRLHMYFGHECNKRNINNLLDSCKMTLQDKGNGEEKVDKDNEDKLQEEKNTDEDDGNHKDIEFVFESNENQNISREDDLGKGFPFLNHEKLNIKQFQDRNPHYGQFVDPNENKNTDLEKEIDVQNENSNEELNENSNEKELESNEKQSESNEKQSESNEKQSESNEKQSESNEKQSESNEKQNESNEKQNESNDKSNHDKNVKMSGTTLRYSREDDENTDY